MAQLITILVDIALGALAYRLAYENRKQIAALDSKVETHAVALRKAGLLD